MCRGSGYVLFVPGAAETEVRCGACFGVGYVELHPDGGGRWREIGAVPMPGEDQPPWQKPPVRDRIYGEGVEAVVLD